MGWFKDNVININEKKNYNSYKINFEDSNEDIWYQEKYDKYLLETSILIGKVGFRFIKIFNCGLFSSSYVISIEHNGKK